MATGGRTPIDNLVPSITTSNLSVQSFVPTVSITSDPLAEIRVRTYGAKGDGTTDDSTAIQLAINAAITAGNADIVFEPNRRYVKAAGSAFSLTGLTSASRVKFLGNDAEIYTALPTGPVVTCNTQFDTLSFEDLNFRRPNVVINAFQTIGIVPYDVNLSKLVEVRRCRFVNCDRAIDIGGGGVSPLRRGKLAKVKIIDCDFEYPWGTNSTDTGGRPAIGIYVSWWADTTVIDDNDFDGGADVSNLTNTPDGHPMDGFFISECRANYIRHNRIKNFCVEGLFTANQGQFTQTSAAFTVPAIGNNVTVGWQTFYGADTDAQMIPGNYVHILGPTPYTPAGKYLIVSVNIGARTMVVQNTGASIAAAGGGFIAANAVAGTVIPINTYIGLIDPVANVEAVYEYNQIDQTAVIGGPARNNPAIASYAGRSRIVGNKIKNAVWGISVGGAGANSKLQFTTIGDESLIEGNEIDLNNWNSIDGPFYGIGLFEGALRCTIRDNTIKVPQSKGVNGIIYNSYATVINNVVKATALVFDGAYISRAFLVPNGSAGAFLDKNYAENFDQGLGSLAAPFNFGDGNIIRGCTTPITSPGILLKTKANFGAVASGTQIIPTNTYTKLLVATEQWDATSVFASSTFTAGAPGYFLFRGLLRLLTANANSTQLILYKNGVLAAVLNQLNNHSSNLQMSGNGSFSLAPGNTVELYLWHNKGSDLTVDLTNTLGFFQGNET